MGAADDDLSARDDGSSAAEGEACSEHGWDVVDVFGWRESREGGVVDRWCLTPVDVTKKVLSECETAVREAQSLR